MDEIKWFNNLPDGWSIVKFGQVLDERNEKNSPILTENILSLSVSQGVVPYSEKQSGGNKAKDDLSKYKIAYPNDIVMNSMNVVAGSVNLSKYYGCVSPVYYTLYKKNEDDSIEFYNYIFQTKQFQRSLYGLGNGIMIKESSTGKLNTVRMRIPMEKLTSLLIPRAKPVMQEKIVNYLNIKCKEIDDIIWKTKSLIEEYNTLEESLTCDVVINGLDKSVVYKNTNIDFIGCIPQHWNVTTISNICTKLSRPLKPEYELVICSNHGRVIPRPDNCSGLVSLTENGYQGVEPGDLLIHGMDTWHGAIAVSEISGKCTSVVHVCETEQNKEYLVYYLRSLAFKKVYKGISSGVRENTSDFRSWDKAGIIPVVLPPKDEQDEIVKYLNSKCKEIRKIIKNKEYLVKELEEYKREIIYEYVTGQKVVI